MQVQVFEKIGRLGRLGLLGQVGLPAQFYNSARRADDNFRLECGRRRNSHRARAEGTSRRPETPCHEFLRPDPRCRMIGCGYSAVACRVLVIVSM